ncbi:MAG TPA: hypothetical protein VK539_09055 [Myxococcaceae bacterium]|nr:hypothetical protein [Myxococcaceae bacterium]
MPMRPLRPDLHSAPTMVEMPIPVVGAGASPSAPTVPMKPIRPPAEPPPEPAVSSKVRKALEPAPAPRAPTPPAAPAAPAAPAVRTVSRPPVEARTPAGGRPPVAARPPEVPVVNLERPAPPPPPPAAAKPPAPEPPAPPKAAAPIGAPLAKPPKPPEPAPGRVVRTGHSTSVQLKAGKLHKLLEMADEAKKLARLRRGPSRATRSPFPREAVTLLHDGFIAAEGVSLTRYDISVTAPVQCKPGERTVVYTQNVINQFAVATNPRYAPRPPELRDAGHLFVFDVMSALHTSLESAFPTSFPGVFRPGSAAELGKWLSETARSRGWHPVEGGRLLESMGRGFPVIALADTPVGPRFAVVEPGPPGPGAKPRLASGHEPRGQQQTPEQIFGTSPVRYLAHE